MLGSRIRTFTDPYSYQAAIRSAHGKILVTARGDFRAELVQIELPRLWMQRGRENLPRIFHATLPSERAPIGFLAGAKQAAVHHCGVEVSPSDIIVNGSRSTFHRRTSAPCHWAAMSLTPDDLSTTANAIAGRDLSIPSDTMLVRPTAASMSGLRDLHEFNRATRQSRARYADAPRGGSGAGTGAPACDDHVLDRRHASRGISQYPPPFQGHRAVRGIFGSKTRPVPLFGGDLHSDWCVGAHAAGLLP